MLTSLDRKLNEYILEIDVGGPNGRKQRTINMDFKSVVFMLIVFRRAAAWRNLARREPYSIEQPMVRIVMLT